LTRTAVRVHLLIAFERRGPLSAFANGSASFGSGRAPDRTRYPRESEERVEDGAVTAPNLAKATAPPPQIAAKDMLLCDFAW
jgi:hypothetical protein